MEVNLQNKKLRKPILEVTNSAKMVLEILHNNFGSFGMMKLENGSPHPPFWKRASLHACNVTDWLLVAILEICMLQG